MRVAISAKRENSYERGMSALVYLGHFAVVAVTAALTWLFYAADRERDREP